MGILRNAFIVVAVLAIRASADTDIEKADKLFEKGISLRETNLIQSCEAFEQSLALNPQAIGTLMNVALCDEKLGKIASAVRLFSEARDRAKEGNLPDYVKEAQSHIDTLKDDVSTVTIHFAQKSPGMKVVINDEVVPDAKLADKIPVDPGELEVTVSAPGRLPFETKIMIGKKDTKPIEVPELKKSVEVKSSRRTIGIITAASGAAAIIAGQVIGYEANKKYDDAFGPGKCSRETLTCPAEYQSKTDSARTLGTVGTVVTIIGAAGVGAGVVLWLTAPKDSAPTEKRVTFLPQVTPDSAGFTAIGRF